MSISEQIRRIEQFFVDVAADTVAHRFDPRNIKPTLVRPRHPNEDKDKPLTVIIGETVPTPRTDNPPPISKEETMPTPETTFINSKKVDDNS